MNLRRKILKRIKLTQKSKKTAKNKFFFYINYPFSYVKNKFKGIFQKIHALSRSENFDDAWSTIKYISGYALIGYPIYHLLFVRSSILLTIIGCGAIYYMFQDCFSFIIKQLEKFKSGK